MQAPGSVSARPAGLQRAQRWPAGQRRAGSQRERRRLAGCGGHGGRRGRSGGMLARTQARAGGRLGSRRAQLRPRWAQLRPEVASAEASAAAPAAPSSTSAIGASLPIVSPSCTRILASVPSNGDGTSALTLSVTTSTSGSPTRTWSPTALSHLPMVPSSTPSPSWGMVTWGMSRLLGTFVGSLWPLAGLALHDSEPLDSHDVRAPGEAARQPQ